MAVAVHGGRVHGEHHGAAPAGTYTGRRGAVGGEVHVVPVHGQQTLGADRGQVTGDGAVEEIRRRGGRRQSEVDLDAVPLAGADPGALDREALLVVGGDDVVQFRPGEPEAVCGRRGDQRVDLDPAGLVEGEPDGLGLMAQMSGQVLRHLHGASFVHPLSLPWET